jgi:hypothetical protein
VGLAIPCSIARVAEAGFSSLSASPHVAYRKSTTLPRGNEDLEDVRLILGKLCRGAGMKHM